MFVKTTNVQDLCIVYLSKSLAFGDDYIKYKPESAEMSNLTFRLIKDTFYVKEEYLKIIEVKTKHYEIKPVYRVNKMERLYDGGEICTESYWTDSTVFKNKVDFVFWVNHRWGICIIDDDHGDGSTDHFEKKNSNSEKNKQRCNE